MSGRLDPEYRRSSDPCADAAMDRYARGEDGAFWEVHDALAGPLRGFFQRRVRDAPRADELVQEVMLTVHRARGTYVQGSSVRSWVFAIARNLGTDEARRNGRRDRLFDPREAPDAADALGVAPEDRVARAQLREWLHEALAELPDAQRVAFELVRLDGLTLVEAADATASTVQGIKSRLHRADEALRDAWRRTHRE